MHHLCVGPCAPNEMKTVRRLTSSSVHADPNTPGDLSKEAPVDKDAHGIESLESQSSKVKKPESCHYQSVLKWNKISIRLTGINFNSVLV